MQVLEADAGRGEVVQQAGDAGAVRLGVVGIDELCSFRRKGKLIGRQPGRQSLHAMLPSLRISSAFSSTRMISPLLITPTRSAISSASSM